LFGLRSTIIMPADAPALKRARTERSGGRVIAYDRARDDRDAVAARFLAEHGGVLVHPYNDPNVIAGQGTIGLELAAQCRERRTAPDAVLVSCGGGGLSAGVGLAVRSEFPGAGVYLVEPAGFDDYGRSLVAGAIVANTNTSGSVCDALLAPSPGATGFAINRANHAHGVVVSDEEALAAVAFAFRELKLVVEPGGAVGLAAMLTRRVPDLAGRAAVVVLSGGNIEPATLQRALA
jgi:threonine dehydratase